MNFSSIRALLTSGVGMSLAATVWAAEPVRPALAEPDRDNQLIDVRDFNRSAQAALQQRKGRRITEQRFIEMAKEPNTVVLDTRSAANFRLLHVKGARHLNFSGITTQSLSRVIPDKDTRILIYCNNNFDNEPNEGRPAFESKSPGMALNIPTYITLFAYGYRNVYELGPLLDVRETNIPLAGVKLAFMKQPISQLKQRNQP